MTPRLRSLAGIIPGVHITWSKDGKRSSSFETRAAADRRRARRDSRRASTRINEEELAMNKGPAMRAVATSVIRGAILVIGICGAAHNAAAQTSQWVFVGPDSKLAYKTLPRGDRIMDFSSAGYKGGGIALPVAPMRQTVSPSGGDDTAAIQAAIDAVPTRNPDANGFRGAVLLAPGTFNCSGSLNITTGGVVLRGSGSGAGGTVINMTGAPHLAINIRGAGSWQTVGNSASITDSYVPSGTASFDVNDASGFSVGDTILIHRQVTQAWVKFMGLNPLARYGSPYTWIK